ncbi:MobQ family relaxase [Streptococcus dysgalactiae]|jgi:nickase|uniref:MobQ family relaxase n=2 Tax=Bacillota TaxID=1239 RepID=UPI002001499C|nr:MULTISPECIES: MobQ family relaxase [Bacillota]MDU5127688.1 MobQ family relaxase [Streptococcus anginosus]HEV9129698.1 MobA/MobL family protein [Streptococcus pneumoniae]MCY7076937.1 MobA/MobL family protein [Streptococcus oralis]MDI6415516.1 MobQ family relaxase [Solobacterium moorei]MEE0847992.1 MobQ family relaxase [Streptococcus anginosus]
MEAKSLHTHVDIVTRSKGASVIAKAAYNARDKLNDEHYGKVHDYSKKEDLVFSKIFLPEHISKEFSDREYLWNSVEKIEKSKNSQLARNLLFTLPRELNEEDRIKLISEFIEENFTSKGMIADCNIHNPLASDNEEQPHAHILLTLREIDKQGKWKPKCRKEYILDENGEKIKLKSGNYKSRKVNLNDWNEPDKAKEWRENFSKKANEYLEKNGIVKRIDPRTFEDQGREELPQIHLGTASYQMEKKGIKTERGNHNRKIIAFNLEFKKLKEELSKLTFWIGSLVGKLQSKYDEYKQEKKDELENKAELFNLYEYISIYHDLQGEKAKELKPYASNKKMAADLRRFSKAIYYLRDNKLQTIADLQEKIGTLQSENKNIHQEVKVKSKRIENLNKCFTYADIIKDNKATYDEWNNKTLFKDSFYNSHKEEIDKYKRARAILEKITGSSAIKSKDWQKEMKSLEDEITKLNKQSQAIKEEYENINHIKYAVKIVNDDYGIDLSIEIDKAIKRGEKPSVIAQIKKYQEQQEKYEKKKERTKDNYRKSER